MFAFHFRVQELCGAVERLVSPRMVSTKSGVIRRKLYDVYCDQSSWGGGNRNGTAKKIKLTIIVIIIIIIIIIII